MRVTRKMVAERAGVSEQTVSYILNRTRKFSDKTIKAVNQAIEELNYQPDRIARSMQSQTTNTVAVIVKDMENPIFPSIIKGFQTAAFKKGFLTYICNVIDYDSIDDQIAQVIAQRVDGVYMSLTYNEVTCKIINRFLDNGIKVVLGNKPLKMKHNLPIIHVDFVNGIKKVLNYLNSKGHHEIVYLSGLNLNLEFDERFKTFVSEYKNIYHQEGKVIRINGESDTSVEAGKKLAEEALKKYPNTSCLLATNDLMAFGAIKYCHSIGLKVPEDISVMGIDNIEFSQYSHPGLTTLGYDFVELGKISFETLYDTLYKQPNNSLNEPEIVIDTYIVERKTVGNK